MTKKIKNKSAIAKFVDKRINKIVDERVNKILETHQWANTVKEQINVLDTLAVHVDDLESEFRHEIHEVQDNIPEQYEWTDIKDQVESHTYSLENEVPNEDYVKEIVDESIREALDGYNVEDIVDAVNKISTIKQAISDFGSSVDYV